MVSLASASAPRRLRARHRQQRPLPSRCFQPRALLTHPRDDQLCRLGSKPARVGSAQQRARVEPAVDVLDATAAPADGVLMGLEPGVIQRGGAGLDPAHETELDEQLERRVDRRRARPWELLVDRAMDLLGGRVLAPAAELTEDH